MLVELIKEEKAKQTENTNSIVDNHVLVNLNSNCSQNDVKSIKLTWSNITVVLPNSKSKFFHRLCKNNQKETVEDKKIIQNGDQLAKQT